ncbi:hypothetical protein CG740_15960 [Streptomyces sp. CB01201]|uniref:hypothetical protein n=1 Tax=Streptomyces sp. CB01201 TaxID=2020324 RepID=UPI000C276601|nr:hypothetical protein [Streptomyces sp. CB01201]PJN02513.1 hypothetical protein CG740_15960 [Streptomyces sp. CB01201]
MSAGDRPLVLIEPYAHRGGGHHQRTLAALAASRPGSLVIAPGGPPADLALPGTRVVSDTVGVLAAVLAAGARAAERASAAGRRAFASRRLPPTVRRFPHQVTLLARCLAEAACLRTGRRLAPDAASVVILSASEALHGAAALLGGTTHLRFVHEMVTTEDLPVRLLGRITQHGEKRVIALYPTTAVHEQFALAFPHLPGQVRTFAVDNGLRLTDAERAGARTAFTIPQNAKAVCLVGGWWPYKDIAALDAALARLTNPLHVLVCGTPLDDTVLERWHQLTNVRLHTVPGPVAEPVLRLVYAAADAALVARRPDVRKESGLVMDAARLGVPLIVSTHDPVLTTRLADQPWARLYKAGDADALATALDGLTHVVPEQPGLQAPRRLGMHPADEQVAFLTDTYTRLQAQEQA